MLDRKVKFPCKVTRKSSLICENSRDGAAVAQSRPSGRRMFFGDGLNGYKIYCVLMAFLVIPEIGTSSKVLPIIFGHKAE